jgi:hypothetical protein
MMNHEQAVHSLGDLFQERLCDRERKSLLAHLDSCPECRSMLDTYALLAQALVSHDEADARPSSEILVRYALEDPALSREERERVAAHVAECSSCAEEVLSVREAEHDATRPAGVQPLRRYRVALLAAAAALALLAFPAYVGLRVLVGRAPAASAGATQIALSRTIWLHGPSRDATEPLPQVEIAPGQSIVRLGVVLGLFEEYAGVERVLFDLRDAAGRSVGSFELPAEAALRSAREDGGVLLDVPAASLSPGTMTLTVLCGDPAEPLFRTAFVVATSR